MKISGFYKNEDCPRSSDLLDFQRGELSTDRIAEINEHLDSCEFCSAEVQFYCRFPQDDNISELTEIPAPLFELADALLKHRHSDANSLNTLLIDKRTIVVDGVN